LTLLHTSWLSGGVQAGKLADELNQREKWIMSSDPTSSSAYKTERYAFIWKTANHKEKLGEPG
jgi:hypothetical protein